MRVLPPEDPLEALERHVEVDQAEFRGGAVFGEERFPIRLRERRDRADEWLPLDDRQPGPRKARHAADDDDRENHRGTQEQPSRDGAPIGGGHDFESWNCTIGIVPPSAQALDWQISLLPHGDRSLPCPSRYAMAA